jgi:hypothetical protein
VPWLALGAGLAIRLKDSIHQTYIFRDNISMVIDMIDKVVVLNQTTRHQYISLSLVLTSFSLCLDTAFTSVPLSEGKQQLLESQRNASSTCIA